MRKNKTLFMQTTKIEPEQTVTEIQRVLGQYGVGAIMTNYDAGEVVGVSFNINIAGKLVAFKLPCRWKSIYEYLYFRKKSRNTDRGLDQRERHAKRVAWRQLLRWTEAQMALVHTGMVKIQEVFMPYIQMTLEGETLYDRLEQQKFKLLTSGKE